MHSIASRTIRPPLVSLTSLFPPFPFPPTSDVQIAVYVLRDHIWRVVPSSILVEGDVIMLLMDSLPPCQAQEIGTGKVIGLKIPEASEDEMRDSAAKCEEKKMPCEKKEEEEVVEGASEKGRERQERFYTLLETPICGLLAEHPAGILRRRDSPVTPKDVYSLTEENRSGFLYQISRDPFFNSSPYFLHIQNYSRYLLIGLLCLFFFSFFFHLVRCFYQPHTHSWAAALLLRSVYLILPLLPFGVYGGYVLCLGIANAHLLAIIDAFELGVLQSQVRERMSTPSFFSFSRCIFCH
jgi:hypothetical protein